VRVCHNKCLTFMYTSSAALPEVLISSVVLDARGMLGLQKNNLVLFKSAWTTRTQAMGCHIPCVEVVWMDGG